MYRSNLNRLILYESDDPVRKTSTIVHEVTHAIQDWKDVRGITRDVEADAFIAGAVVEQTLKRSKIAYIDIDFDDPVHAAARLVIEKKVDERDKVWRGAYDKVVTDVSTSYEFPLLRKNPGREAVVESKIYAQVRSAVDLRQMMWEHMRTSTAQLQRQMSKIDLSSYVGRPQ